ncbi:DUF413 domain-containing protein [Pseudoalteromonas tunicata]|jgi:uncharacterized protein YifE (UPF0438 family)|uniref:Macrodomain Ori protein n=1 Tax=Pseudoalteromonas tunicata D2 TaxID=87626 RepID=A4C7D7_9GAMM|nr:DUF413 domain-containing protein [Pseudoalteromonas tunicata]ATC95862.1 hypothetical protein PTUN_a3553 [Pseudoalteromonas tunicata]AXT31406.1 DUF413 domain-containing protein [Pseudoalteromonas tunicata]EAR29891.1 hypothetical protein PTD2_13764 [Pseudoalteromonas tunicata D2]MDP4982176.1 DUF413 domain-containing protein [Pseudoalteromonas tunicata]MDP5214335.1 DUF413 domain-containing protein [Pseudoalteromonas tunicata]
MRNGLFEFFDDVNFPMGFRRSGSFSIPESELLSSYGDILSKLANQSLAPESPDEVDFVEVCLGNKPAQTKFEKTWLKYKHEISRKDKFYSAFGKKETVKPSTDFSVIEL